MIKKDVLCVWHGEYAHSPSVPRRACFPLVQDGGMWAHRRLWAVRRCGTRRRRTDWLSAHAAGKPSACHATLIRLIRLIYNVCSVSTFQVAQLGLPPYATALVLDQKVKASLGG